MDNSTTSKPQNSSSGETVGRYLVEGSIGLIAGSLGGAANVFVGQPLDTLKVKLQTFPRLYSNSLQCFKKTLINEGFFRGLYAGTIPALAANIAENSVLFAAHGFCQKGVTSLTGNLGSPTPLENAIAGFFAAFFSSFTLCPTELVKCRLQSLHETGQSGKYTAFDIIRQIMRNEGFTGLFRGLTPTFAREMPGYFFFFGGYETSRYFLTNGQPNEAGLSTTIIAGGIGGMCLWTSIFPFDVAKSRMQIEPTNDSMFIVMKKIYRYDGFRALYKGLGPTLLRTFPGTGALFVAVEYSKDFMTKNAKSSGCPADRDHNVRCVYGNSFRPSLWKEFLDRFGVKQIVEFYGATEGNSSTVNLDNREGSCGFISVLLPEWILKRLYPVVLIKVDPETGDPVRNSEGLCCKVKPGEVGQMIGMIKPKDPIKRFDGYADAKATEKKIISDVFKKGDSYYASGDLLTMDELGYYYFSDRTGDTFRWKGENVSTGEVEGVLDSLTHHADVVVFGALVPGSEGRAGMAAIGDPNRSLDLKSLLNKMKKELPHYAIPVFIRLTSDIEVTSTFKMPKVSLKKEGYDLNLVKDPIYVLDWKSEEYKRLDEKLYQTIINGEYKF